MTTANLEQVDAKRGEKMIELRVRFWTNAIAPDKGKVFAKHAWSSGEVRMPKNDSHGIVPVETQIFDNMGELQDAIERTLIAHGVKLHPGGRDANLYAVTDAASGAPLATRRAGGE